MSSKDNVVTIKLGMGLAPAGNEDGSVAFPKSPATGQADRQPDRKRITWKNRPPARPDELMSGEKNRPLSGNDQLAETSIAVSELPHTSGDRLV
jgi:hypothetical protein